MAITLAEVPIPVPCPADLARMRPTRGGRYCRECRHEVHDLSTMSETQVRRLLRASAGARVCVSYQPGPEGTVLTRLPQRPRLLAREQLLRKVRPSVLAASALLASGCGAAYDTLPDAVQRALPEVAQAALQHPVDFAACAVDSECDASTFGQPSWLPILGSTPMVAGLLVVPTVLPEERQEALPAPCLHDDPPSE